MIVGGDGENGDDASGEGGGDRGQRGQWEGRRGEGERRKRFADFLDWLPLMEVDVVVPYVTVAFFCFFRHVRRCIVNPQRDSVVIW